MVVGPVKQPDEVLQSEMALKPQGTLIRENVELKPYTSWQVGGPADFFSQPSSLEELRGVLIWAHDQNHPVTLLGGGTNVLISDLGIRGLTIGLQKLKHLDTEVVSQGGTTTDNSSPGGKKRLILRAEAGVTKTEILRVFLKWGLSPALFLSGIPGEVGGGVVMNAGVSPAESFSPREMGEIVDRVEVLKPEYPHYPLRCYEHSDLTWSYRHTEGWQPGIIYRVQMSWPLEPHSSQDSDLISQVRRANQRRLEKQPLDWPSCGSVFINPPGEGLKAAQCIDLCDLKGFSIGGAQVSKKHANFIVNLGEASAHDIWNIIEHVRKVVFNKKGIHLTTEVLRLGDWPS